MGQYKPTVIGMIYIFPLTCTALITLPPGRSSCKQRKSGPGLSNFLWATDLINFLESAVLPAGLDGEMLRSLFAWLPLPGGLIGITTN